MHFRFDSSRFASLVFSVLPCQDFPLGHRGIISLVGYLGGEVGAARRPRKEAFNKEPRPCLPIGPRGLHRDSPCYLLSNIRSNIRPQTLPLPTPPCSEPRPLASVWRGGGRPSHPRDWPWTGNQQFPLNRTVGSLPWEKNERSNLQGIFALMIDS